MAKLTMVDVGEVSSAIPLFWDKTLPQPTKITMSKLCGKAIAESNQKLLKAVT